MDGIVVGVLELGIVESGRILEDKNPAVIAEIHQIGERVQNRATERVERQVKIIKIERIEIKVIVGITAVTGEVILIAETTDAAACWSRSSSDVLPRPCP